MCVCLLAFSCACALTRKSMSGRSPLFSPDIRDRIFCLASRTRTPRFPDYGILPSKQLQTLYPKSTRQPQRELVVGPTLTENDPANGPAVNPCTPRMPERLRSSRCRDGVPTAAEFVSSPVARGVVGVVVSGVAVLDPHLHTRSSRRCLACASRQRRRSRNFRCQRRRTHRSRVCATAARFPSEHCKSISAARSGRARTTAASPSASTACSPRVSSSTVSYTSDCAWWNVHSEGGQETGRVRGRGGRRGREGKLLSQEWSEGGRKERGGVGRGIETDGWMKADSMMRDARKDGRKVRERDQKRRN